LELTQEEKDVIIAGLQMRMCYIETGNPLLRACDVRNENTNKVSRFQKHQHIMPLSTHQMKIIITSEELIKKLL
jgi:hypothetical protein